jgi:hypothetical protein
MRMSIEIDRRGFIEASSIAAAGVIATTAMGQQPAEAQKG